MGSFTDSTDSNINLIQIINRVFKSLLIVITTTPQLSALSVLSALLTKGDFTQRLIYKSPSDRKGTVLHLVGVGNSHPAISLDIDIFKILYFRLLIVIICSILAIKAKRNGLNISIANRKTRCELPTLRFYREYLLLSFIV